MRFVLISLILAAIMFLAGWFSYAYLHKVAPSEVVQETREAVTKPLEKYSIENLQKANFASGAFRIEKELEDEKDYKALLFSFTFNPEVEGNTKKKITGRITTPKGEGTFPLVVMFRGFVDQTLYQTGIGTKPAANYFSQNGFITISPDFLGYAGSSEEAKDIFETRLQTYTTAVSLLKSLTEASFTQTLNNKWDQKNVFIWGHSNGGHIALTALSITGVTYPTTLWAPASKSFPYVILYYTDDAEDSGKFIRRELSAFENLYDVDKFSYTNYLDSINAPIQLHQGTADTAVPVLWSGDLVTKLRAKGKEVTYYTYPNADHNLRPSWDEVVQRDVEFFRSKLGV